MHNSESIYQLLWLFKFMRFIGDAHFGVTLLQNLELY